MMLKKLSFKNINLWTQVLIKNCAIATQSPDHSFIRTIETVGTKCVLLIICNIFFSYKYFNLDNLFVLFYKKREYFTECFN